MYGEKALEFTAEQISQINDLIEASTCLCDRAHHAKLERIVGGGTSRCSEIAEHMRGIRFIKKSMEGLVFAIAGEEIGEIFTGWNSLFVYMFTTLGGLQQIHQGGFEPFFGGLAAIHALSIVPNSWQTVWCFW